MIGAAKGYDVKLCMPACVSAERRLVLEAFHAEVVMTPAKEGTDGAIRQAQDMLAADPDSYYMPDQFSNEANVLSHYETTGPEVYSQTNGAVDVFVAGMGTTGTLMGAARYLRERKPGVGVIGVEPPKGHTIQGLKNMGESIVPRIYDPGELDEKVMIDDGEAFDMARQAATTEGLFVGMSSGAALAAATQVAQKMNSGTIVVILPDRGDRYLSTTLFRSVCAKCPP
jgi:cysteine synthase B